MSSPDPTSGAARLGAAPAPDGQGDGAPADRPARSLGLFGLLLVGVLGAGLGLGAAVGPLDPPGAPSTADHPDQTGRSAPDHG